MISASKWRRLNSAGRFRRIQAKAYQANQMRMQHNPKKSSTR